MIVGAGISGAWCALELARRGQDVVVLDARVPGDGATGRNAGFLLAESDCLGLAAVHHGEAVARGLRDVGLRTRAMVRELVASRRRSVGLSFPGSVRLAEDAGEARAFERSADAALDGVRTVPVSSVRERGAADRYTAALLDAGDGLLHPLRLLALVLDEARRAGAVVLPRTAVRDVARSGGGVRVRTVSGDVRADEMVVATSAAARRLVPSFRPIRPVRAQALVARVSPDPGWKRPVYATRGGEYWRPLGPGRVLLGGLRRLRKRHENTASEHPSRELQGRLDRFLRSLLGPDDDVEVTHRWAGTMAFTPYGLPWVGRLPRRRGVSVIAGMNGHGMGWAPALAASLAAHLADDAPPPPAFARPRP